MIALVVLLGLALGVALNRLIARQLHDPALPAAPASPLYWVPLGGAMLRRAWLDVAVEALTVIMTVVLWQYYGWSLRFVLLLGATLVLIDTAAVDWKVKLIDTLIMLAATVLAVALAPWITDASWRSSLLGLLAAGVVFILFFIIAKILYPQQAAPFGLGDVYLGMFIGALLGLFRMGPALFYGMMLAGFASFMLILVLGLKRARHIPISYGTFLCLGVLLYLATTPV